MSFQLPDYTSPPLADALEATPIEYQSDEVIDEARRAASQKKCGSDRQYCQIGFPAQSLLSSSSSSESQHQAREQQPAVTTGVILYGGALVDPRSYSPLARTLQVRYGLTVVVPIFDKDLAWDYTSCSTGRVQLAQQQYPNVQQWILAGHSFGALAASLDLWTLYTSESSSSSHHPTAVSSSSSPDVVVSGMVFMAADPRGDLGCGSLNFSMSELPFASLTATLDERLNRTRWEENRQLLPANTFYLDILGGNHGQYGSYNDTLRLEILHQGDTPADIPREIQQDLAAAAIANVAARAGWAPPPTFTSTVMGDSGLPQYPNSHGYFRTSTVVDPTTSWIWTTVVLIVGFFWKGGKQSLQTISSVMSSAGRNQ